MTGATDSRRNRELWTEVNRQYTDARADVVWRRPGIRWGIFEIPEEQLGVLGDVRGRDVVELGCGTAFLSAALARAGARPVGVDPTHAQLVTARRCQDEYGPRFPLIEADGQAVPLADQSWDVVVSEYGASVWCDPAIWLSEAARLLRPRGLLVFLTSSVLVTLCVPAESGRATTSLQRPQRRASRVEWPGGGVEFHPAHGEWLRLLRSSGFVVEGLHELYAPSGARTPEYYEIADPHWAAQWPVEDLWVARRR